MSRYANKFAQARKAAKARDPKDDRPLVDRLVDALQADLDDPKTDKTRRATRQAARTRRKVAK